jgi:hypothetical protein
MNDLYKLNMLLKEMNWMAKEVDYLLSDLSRSPKVLDESYRDAFDSWYRLFNTELIEHMKEYTDAMIEEMEEE